MNDNKDSYTQNYMLSFDEALHLIKEHCSQLASETVKLTDCSGRVLAEDIVSPISVPTFDNSAMDGYAVNFMDLATADKENPITLNLIGLTAAGDNIAEARETNKTAWKIMTGAPLPTGYDSIIAVENTELSTDNRFVSCFSAPTSGAHVRSSGEDFVKGNVVLKDKQIINANRIMALASLGVAEMKVIKKPHIAVFSTGKELVDDPSNELQPGQIYNSNMPYILEYLKDLPVEAHNAGTNYDEVELYQQALQEELNDNTDIIISTGAVSMGDFDFIPQTIIKMGGEIIFHKSKIRPGKPILFAKFPNGSYYFGLPGNPISATIGLRFFVTHLINLMIGMPEEKPVKAKLLNDKFKKKGIKNILKAHAKIDLSANFVAEIAQGQESFKIHPLLDANGWVVLPEEMENAETNELVDFYFSNLDLNH